MITRGCAVLRLGQPFQVPRSLPSGCGVGGVGGGCVNTASGATSSGRIAMRKISSSVHANHAATHPGCRGCLMVRFSARACKPCKCGSRAPQRTIMTGSHARDLRVTIEFPERTGSMEYRQLGRAGVRVSVLGLGTNRFGSDRLPLAEVSKMLDAALDIGINFIDASD